MLKGLVTRLREAGSRTSDEPHLEAAAVAARFDHHHSVVTAAKYVHDLQFLVDFHGRDLLKEFRLWLESLGVSLTYESMVKALTSAMVDVYSLNRNIYGTDDFLHLANGVRNLAGLPPLP
jgi:hypothetical protein